MRSVILLIGLTLMIGCEQHSFGSELARQIKASVPGIPAAKASVENDPPTEWRIHSIDWDDADSGRINGVRFRLSNVDAPETGGVGAAIGGANCGQEREQGLRAKAWMIEQTPPVALQITNTDGYDSMREPRLLVHLSVNGRDVGEAGIAAGYLKPWPHIGSKKLAAKPSWCDQTKTQVAALQDGTR